jgi:hypothetical protein
MKKKTKKVNPFISPGTTLKPLAESRPKEEMKVSWSRTATDQVTSAANNKTVNKSAVTPQVSGFRIQSFR